MFTVSLVLSIEANSEEAALVEFERRIKAGEYESGNFDVEPELED